MILDRIEHAALYAPLSARMKAALEFLGRPDLATLPLGRHEIDGENVHASVQAYTTRDRGEGRHEAHRRHIDVQCILEGGERFSIAPLEALRPLVPYDEARDAEFRAGAGPEVVLQAGQFVILYPHEAHQPGLHPAQEPVAVRKVVVKVRL